MSRRPTPPRECPVCGADLSPRARACPECGADERTGWNEDDARYDGLDLPDSAFDDDDAGQSPRKSPAAARSRQLFWSIVGLTLIVLLVYRVLGGS